VEDRLAAFVEARTVLEQAINRWQTCARPQYWVLSAGRAKWNQKMVTLYAVAASRTGWKNVVPPLVQSPLPPEVRPSALVPS